MGRGILLSAIENQGKLQKAIQYLDYAIQLYPDNAEVYNNRGVVFREFKQFNKALDSFDKAIQLNPDYTEAYSNLGSLLSKIGQFDQAIKNYQIAIRKNPNYAEAYYNYANMLSDLGYMQEALENYDSCIRLENNFITAYSNRALTLNYCIDITADKIFKKHCELEHYLKNHLMIDQFIANKRYKNPRIKVAYLSPDFHTHSVSYFFLPLLKSHNKNLLESYCYYNNDINDGMTTMLKNTAEHWRSIKDLNDQAVVELIIKDNIDILIDMAGHTSNNRLTVFSYKAAPIQISWLGYPNTTGINAINYRFTDEIADPVGESDQFYSEQLIRLPHGFLCYQGDETIPMQQQLPAIKNGYITFASFNNLSKINNLVINVWSKILNALPESKLVLKSKFFTNSEIKSRYLNLFAKQGIEISRIRLLSFLAKKEDHLGMYNTIDIGLDPFPYNGTTTTCEALWMGVPTITLKGNRHSSRVGTSIMTHIGLEEFIAKDEQEYINIAIQLANNTLCLANIRAHLRQQLQDSTLCDSDQFAQDIEGVYANLYEKQLNLINQD
jgi:protein O-GlcNAc transferase